MIRFLLLLLLLPGAEFLTNNTDELEPFPKASLGTVDNMAVTPQTMLRKSSSASRRLTNKASVPQTQPSKKLQKPQLLKDSPLTTPVRVQPAQRESLTGINNSTNKGQTGASLTPQQAHPKPSKMPRIINTGKAGESLLKGAKPKKIVTPIRSKGEKHHTGKDISVTGSQSRRVLHGERITIPIVYPNISIGYNVPTTTLKVHIDHPVKTSVKMDVADDILQLETVANKTEHFSSVVHTQLSKPPEEHSWVNRILESIPPLVNPNSVLGKLQQFVELSPNSTFASFVQEKELMMDRPNSLLVPGQSDKVPSASSLHELKDGLGEGIGTYETTTLGTLLEKQNDIVSKPAFNSTGVDIPGLSTMTDGTSSTPTEDKHKINIKMSDTRTLLDHDRTNNISKYPFQEGLQFDTQQKLTTQLQPITQAESGVTTRIYIKAFQPWENSHRHKHLKMQTQSQTGLESTTRSWTQEKTQTEKQNKTLPDMNKEHQTIQTSSRQNQTELHVFSRTHAENGVHNKTKINTHTPRTHHRVTKPERQAQPYPYTHSTHSQPPKHKKQITIAQTQLDRESEADLQTIKQTQQEIESQSEYTTPIQHGAKTQDLVEPAVQVQSEKTYVHIDNEGDLQQSTQGLAVLIHTKPEDKETDLVAVTDAQSKPATQTQSHPITWTTTESTTQTQQLLVTSGLYKLTTQSQTQIIIQTQTQPYTVTESVPQSEKNLLTQTTKLTTRVQPDAPNNKYSIPVINTATPVQSQAELDKALHNKTRTPNLADIDVQTQTEPYTMIQASIKTHTPGMNAKYQPYTQTEPESATQLETETSTQTQPITSPEQQTQYTQTQPITSTHQHTQYTQTQPITSIHQYTQTQPKISIQQQTQYTQTQPITSTHQYTQTQPITLTHQHTQTQPITSTHQYTQTQPITSIYQHTQYTQTQPKVATQTQPEQSTQSKSNSATQFQIEQSTPREIKMATQYQTEQYSKTKPKMVTQTQPDPSTQTQGKLVMPTQPETSIKPGSATESQPDLSSQRALELTKHFQPETSKQTVPQPDQSTQTVPDLSTQTHQEPSIQTSLALGMQTKPEPSMQTESPHQNQPNQTTQTTLRSTAEIEPESVTQISPEPITKTEFTNHTQTNLTTQTKFEPSEQTQTVLETQTQPATTTHIGEPSTQTETYFKTQINTVTKNHSTPIIPHNPTMLNQTERSTQSQRDPPIQTEKQYITQSQPETPTKTQLIPIKQNQTELTQTEPTHTMRTQSKPIVQTQPELITKIQTTQTEQHPSAHTNSDITVGMWTTHSQEEAETQTQRDQATQTQMRIVTNNYFLLSSVPESGDTSTTVSLEKSPNTKSWHGKSHSEYPPVTEETITNISGIFPTYSVSSFPTATDGLHSRTVSETNVIIERGSTQRPDSKESTTMMSRPSSQPFFTTIQPQTPEVPSTPTGRSRIFIVDEQLPVFKVERINVTYRMQLNLATPSPCEQSDPCQSRILQEVTSLYESVPGFDGIEVLNVTLDKALEYRVQLSVQAGSVMAETQERLLRDPSWIFGSTRPSDNLRSRIRSISLAEHPADPCTDWFSCPEGFQCVSARALSARCASPCHRNLCHNQGICIHQKEKEPECQCPIGRDFWYMGQRCDYRMTHLRLATIACGAVFCIIICAAAAVFFLVRRFQQQILQQKVAQTQSSYRRFSRFDDVPTHFWCPSQTWLTTSASLNSLDNPAFSSSEEVFPLQALGSCVCGCQDGAPNCAQTDPPQPPARVPPRLETSCSSVNDLMIDSGKASDVSVSSWPMEPIHWTPFPILHQLSLQSPFHARRPHSYFEGMELVNTERSWTA